MARFLQKLAASGTRTLGDLSASARSPARPNDALPEIIEEHVAARGASEPAPALSGPREASGTFRTEAPLPAPSERRVSPGHEAALPPTQGPARVSSPGPLSAVNATSMDSRARSASPEASTAARSELPGPAAPRTSYERRAAAPQASLRDADIRVADSSSAPGLPRQSAPRAAASSPERADATGDSTASPPDALAPFKERWRELGQRLRMSHPPPLPEAAAAEPPPPPAPRLAARREQPAEDPAPRSASPRKASAPPAGMDPGRSPSSPSLAATTVTFSAAAEPPRRQSAPSQAPGARPPQRGPELVIGNLEVRIVPMTPAPQAPQPSPAPRSTPSGSWQSATRRYLGRL